MLGNSNDTKRYKTTWPQKDKENLSWILAPLVLGANAEVRIVDALLLGAIAYQLARQSICISNFDDYI